MAFILFQDANTAKDKIIFVVLLTLIIVFIALIDPYLIKIKKEVSVKDISVGYVALVWILIFIFMLKFVIIP